MNTLQTPSHVQPTMLSLALAQVLANVKPEPIPVGEVSEASMVDFELADLLGAPAKPEPYRHTAIDTEFWIKCQVEQDLAFME